MSVVTHHYSDGASTDELRKLVMDVRDRIQDRPSVVAITSLSEEDRPLVVVAVNEQARERGLKAGSLVCIAAKILKGGGGGKDDVAQGGGTDPLTTRDALREVVRVVGQTGSP